MKLTQLRNTLFEDIKHTDQDFMQHFHDTYTIGITHNGMFKSAIGREISYSYAQSVRIINPTEIHGGEGNSWAYTNFYPTAELLSSIYEQIFQVYRIPVFEKHIINDRHMYKLLYDFFLSVYQNDNPIEIETNLIDALSYLIKNYTHHTKEPDSKLYKKEIIQESINYINDTIESNISLDSLAKSVSLSKYHFLRLFKHHMGVTPHHYILTAKVMKAKSMIASGANISDASYSNGFSDQSHFTRSFKKIYGYTPASMRKNSNIILYK